jgi:hypothetical protein
MLRRIVPLAGGVQTTMTVFLYLVAINPERTVGIQDEVHEVTSRRVRHAAPLSLGSAAFDKPLGQWRADSERKVLGVLGARGAVGRNRNLNQIVGKLWKRLGIIFSKPSTASNWHGS